MPAATAIIMATPVIFTSTSASLTCTAAGHPEPVQI